MINKELKTRPCGGLCDASENDVACTCNAGVRHGLLWEADCPFAGSQRSQQKADTVLEQNEPPVQGKSGGNQESKGVLTGRNPLH